MCLFADNPDCADSRDTQCGHHVQSLASEVVIRHNIFRRTQHRSTVSWGLSSMSRKRKKKKHSQPDNAAVTLPGTVEKIIPPIEPEQPEKAQIAVEGADELYEKLRIENTLQ